MYVCLVFCVRVHTLVTAKMDDIGWMMIWKPMALSSSYECRGVMPPSIMLHTRRPYRRRRKRHSS